MKNKIIAVSLCFSLIFSISLFNREKAYADPFTASQIASTAYAMMQSWGISFTAGSASASGMNDFMTNQVQDYVNSKGGSIADLFVGQIAVDTAGKLVVAHTMYNSVVGFLDWLKDKFSLSSTRSELTQGEYADIFLPSNIQGDTVGAYRIQFHSNWPSGSYGYQGYFLFEGERRVESAIFTNEWRYQGTWGLNVINGYLYCVTPVINRDTGDYVKTDSNLITYVGTLNNSLSWYVPESWTMPTVLNPDKEWTGTIGGYSAPDTNLDQLLGNIDQAVADNNLVVDGDVIDIPIPTPTPMPIDPDIPLKDVPWEGLDNNLQQLYEQGLEEIGTIGEARDAITGAVGEQTGALEDAIANNAGVVSGAIDQAVSDVDRAIADNAGVVSGAIDQAVSDVQTAIGEQTAVLDESLSSTAEGVETIAEAIEDEEINWRTFDLRGLFPFCIPFDIYNMLKALDASPVSPHVQLPFIIESIGFTHMIDLDFSAFDSVAAIMRQMELICYGLALAWATSKVIKW